MPPPFADPRWHVINLEMSYTDGAICAPLLKSWEGHVLPPAADPRWLFVNYVVKKLGRFGNRFGPFWSGPFRIWAVLTIHQMYIGFIWIHGLLFLNVPLHDENDD